VRWRTDALCCQSLFSSPTSSSTRMLASVSEMRSKHQLQPRVICPSSSSLIHWCLSRWPMTQSRSEVFLQSTHLRDWYIRVTGSSPRTKNFIGFQISSSHWHWHQEFSEDDNLFTRVSTRSYDLEPRIITVFVDDILPYTLSHQSMDTSAFFFTCFCLEIILAAFSVIIPPRRR
jgi:hypothetical protein